MILLDVGRCRGMEMSFRGAPDQISRWLAEYIWCACSECLWLTPRSRWWDYQCGRPADEPTRYGGSVQLQGTCHQLGYVSIVRVDPLVNTAIWSTLMIGGTNAVIEMVSGLQPADLHPALPTSLEKYKQRRDLREITHGKLHAG